VLDLWGEPLVESEPDVKEKKASLFDCLGSLTSGRDIRLIDPELKSFDPYMIGKGLQQNIGTIGFAAEMNKLRVPKEAQFLYYHYGIPNLGRGGKWAKKTVDKNLSKLVTLGYLEKQAKEIIYVMTAAQVKDLIKKLELQKKLLNSPTLKR
jgi:hypothetical protein